MKKLLIILMIIIIGVGTWFYFQQKEKISEKISPEEQLKNLGLIIFKNTKFEDFSIDNFSFKYPNWKKVEIDPLLIWPKEIAEKEKILLYLINPDEVKMLVTKRELSSEDLTKPFPLIFREVFAQNREIMEKEGGLSALQIVREEFFENGVTHELKVIILGKTITSISKSIILKERDRGFIYSVGIAASDRIFEDYRPLADYIIDSIRYY